MRKLIIVAAAVMLAGSTVHASAEKSIEVLLQNRAKAVAVGNQDMVARYDDRITELQQLVVDRDVADAQCRMAAYQAHVSDVADYITACMRVEGYVLESDGAFKLFCSIKAHREERC